MNQPPPIPDSPIESTGAEPRSAVRAEAVALVLVLLLILALQIVSLGRVEAVLNDSARMDSLDRMERVVLAEDRVLHHLHLAGSVLGLLAAAMLLASREDGERLALGIVAAPIAISTASWGVWAITHLGDVATSYGPGILIGLIGILAGLICPFCAAWIVYRGCPTIGARRRHLLGLLCLLVLAWTIVTIRQMLPFVAAA